MASLHDFLLSTNENSISGKYINAQTGTSYTLALADAGCIVTLDNGGAIALEVPANATVAFQVGTIIELWQIGAGAVTVAGDVGVTVNAVGGTLVFSAQYQRAILEKTGTNTWLFDLAANSSGFVPTSRTVNGEALSGNITLVLASDDFANQGTTTTVLHGNAAGNPAFGAVVEADITLADNTTNDVSTTKHGFSPKAPNDATKYLDGTGAWSVPVGAGGIASGTSFPGSPSSGDLFWRTDLDLICFYDGTRWLTTGQYVIELKPHSNTFATAMTGTTAYRMLGWKPCAASIDFWMETAVVSALVGVANDGSNHWTIDFESDDGPIGTPTAIVSINTNTEGWTVGQFSVASATINALLGTTQRAVYIDCTEVGASNLTVYDAKIVGRLVIT